VVASELPFLAYVYVLGGHAARAGRPATWQQMNVLRHPDRRVMCVGADEAATVLAAPGGRSNRPSVAVDTNRRTVFCECGSDVEYLPDFQR
jgi:hypothetical protein